MSKDSGLQKKEAGGKSSKKRAKFSIPVGTIPGQGLRDHRASGHHPGRAAVRGEEPQGARGPGFSWSSTQTCRSFSKRDILPKHPNIVPAMASVSKDGVPRYVVTGPPQGESLARVGGAKGAHAPGAGRLGDPADSVRAERHPHEELPPRQPEPGVRYPVHLRGRGDGDLLDAPRGRSRSTRSPRTRASSRRSRCWGRGTWTRARISGPWACSCTSWFTGGSRSVGNDKDEISGKILLKDPGFPMDARIPEELRAWWCARAWRRSHRIATRT